MRRTLDGSCAVSGHIYYQRRRIDYLVVRFGEGGSIGAEEAHFHRRRAVHLQRVALQKHLQLGGLGDAAAPTATSAK